MHKLILLGVLPAIAMARRGSPPFFLRRTEYEAKTCEELGLQQCGTGCIPLEYTCCPGEVGGCPEDFHCIVADDGQDACCQDDFVCTGNGGVIETTFTLTETTSVSSDVPEPTTTTTADADTSSSTEALPSSTTTEAASTTAGGEYTTPTTTGESQSTTSTGEESSQSSSTGGASSTETASASETSSSTGTASEESTSTSVSVTASESASQTTATTSFSTSTVYTTTTKTITSCPASHPCQSGTGHGSVILVTETIAVSTTLCPVIESPPLPTPTASESESVGAKPTINDNNHHPGQHQTTAFVPIIKPVVVCPGQGDACHPVSVSGGGAAPTSVGLAPSEYSGVYYPPPTTSKVIGTGSWTTRPAATSQAAVTAGAARMGMGLGMGVGVAIAGAVAVQGVF